MVGKYLIDVKKKDDLEKKNLIIQNTALFLQSLYVKGVLQKKREYTENIFKSGLVKILEKQIKKSKENNELIKGIFKNFDKRIEKKVIEKKKKELEAHVIGFMMPNLAEHIRKKVDVLDLLTRKQVRKIFKMLCSFMIKLSQKQQNELKLTIDMPNNQTSTILNEDANIENLLNTLALYIDKKMVGQDNKEHAAELLIDFDNQPEREEIIENVIIEAEEQQRQNQIQFEHGDNLEENNMK